MNSSMMRSRVKRFVTIEFYACSPSLALSNDASPPGWSRIWSHLLANAANHSRISTSKAIRGLPWAQGVAGSNPVAPTSFLRVLSGHIGNSSFRR